MQVATLAGEASLSGIRKQIRSQLNEKDVPPALAFDCLVAVTEACTNALLHGRGGPNHPLPEISWTVTEHLARFQIRDYSELEGAEPVHSDPEDHPRDGGYGLKMMRKLMDEVDITFSPRGTTVTMEKRY